MPAILFVIFEGWDYALAVYYAFVTLTTIGFGDYVAGKTIYIIKLTVICKNKSLLYKILLFQELPIRVMELISFYIRYS